MRKESQQSLQMAHKLVVARRVQVPIYDPPLVINFNKASTQQYCLGMLLHKPNLLLDSLGLTKIIGIQPGNPCSLGSRDTHIERVGKPGVFLGYSDDPLIPIAIALNDIPGLVR